MKKILTLILSLSLLCALAACDKKTTQTKKSTVSKTATDVAETGSEESVKEAEAVAVGNTITLDFAEMTVAEAAVADEIKTSIKTGNVTYTTGPDSSADKDFVYIRGSIKNVGKSEISNPDFSGSVEIDGYSYELKSASIIESDGRSAYSLEPLMTYTYTLYAEVPNELLAEFQECKLNFGFEENFESSTIYSDKEYVPTYSYTVNITK